MVHNRGSTIIEVITAIGVLALLIGFITVNFGNISQKTSLSASVDTLVGDLRTQQLKAMVGDTEGRATSDTYGVHFDTNDYVLFHGGSFQVVDSSNFMVSLPSNLQFTTVVLPGSEIVFAKGSGQFVSYALGSNAISLKSTVTGETKTIIINKFGVITAIN